MYTKKIQTIFSPLRASLAYLLCVMLLASCVSEEESEATVAGNTCYISGVSFPSFRKAGITKASDGVTDSTYYTTYSATNWVFTIDHKTLFVENRDSLPCNTDLSRVVMNLSYTAGTAYYRSSAAWADDPWLPYQATDSIDFRQPLNVIL